MTEFTSGFAKRLDAMLDFRKARGYKRETYFTTLVKFDRYCAEQFPEASDLTCEIVHSWLDNETASLRKLTGAAGAIRQFGKYLNAVGEEAYVLPDKFAPSKTAFVPYIFSDSELTALFTAIDTIPPDKNEPFLNEIIPVLFRLTYTCGLRPHESRTLLAENVNLDTGEVLITHTKMNKERFVVMSDDMLVMCRGYELRRKIIGGNNPYFFPSNNGSAFTSDKILATFNKAWTIAACNAGSSASRQVRVYDLRHRFASARLNRWLDEGENLMVMLPYLRAYMGHATMTETAYYIHILPENLVKSSAIDWGVFNAMFPDVQEVAL